MAKIGFLVDSLARIPDELMQQYHIHVIPLRVVFGQESLREQVDITDDEFLTRLRAARTLPTTSQALYLVQRIRDEAHRFAITYHRDLRRKAAVRSRFDDLPGIGPRRRAALLRVFGSIKRVKDAPIEQIAAVPGIGPNLAARIKANLEAI